MNTPEPQQNSPINEKAETSKDSLTDPDMIDFASLLDDFMDEEVVDSHIHVLGNDVGTLAEDAPALMVDTSEVPTDKIVEGIAFAGRKKMIGRVRDKALEGAMTADQTVREHPYETIGIAFSVAALIGFLLARRDGN